MSRCSVIGIHAKIKRAEKHIDEFDAELTKFFALNPYGILRKDNLEAASCTFYVTKVTEVPPRLSAIIGDVLHNFRTALDHLAHQLVIAADNEPTTMTQFPICKTSEHYETKGFRYIEGVRDDVEKEIKILQPYTRSDPNDTLLALHELDIRDKHRLLLTAGTRFYAHSLTPSQRERILRNFHGSYGADHPAPDLRGVMIPPMEPARFPLEAGDELVTLPISEVKQDMSFNFHIAFNEPGVIQGEPVLVTFQRIGALVRAIATDFERFLK